MKKLFFTLVACIVGLSSAFAAAPDALYIAGNKQSWKAGEESYKMTPSGTNTWTFTAPYDGIFSDSWKITSADWGWSFGMGADFVIDVENDVWYEGQNFRPITTTGGTVTVTFTYVAGSDVKNSSTPSKVKYTISGGTEIESYPETLCLIGNFGSSNWDPSQAKSMTKTGEGKFSISGVELSTGGNDAYFSFCEKPGTNSGDWAIGTRYGSPKNDYELTSGTPAEIKKGENSFKGGAGTYNIVVDLVEGTMTATWSTTGEPDTPVTPGEAPDVFYLMGTTGNWQSAFATLTKSETPSGNGEIVYEASNVTLNGEFKLNSKNSGTDWTGVNYGARYPDNSTFSVNGMEAEGYQTLDAWVGVTENFKASNLSNVTVTFYYNQDAGQPSYLKVSKESTVTPTPTYPETLYIMGSVGEYTGFAPGNGIAVKGEEGVYTWSNVKVNKSGQQENGQFNFATVLGTVGGQWDTDGGPNTGDRYGAEDDNISLVSGTPTAIKLYAVNVSASGCKAWNITPGTYNIVADLKTMKVTATAVTTEPEPDPVPDGTALVFQTSPRLEMTMSENVTTAVSLDIPLYLTETFEYSGFQFNVTVPSWLDITKVVTSSDLGGETVRFEEQTSAATADTKTYKALWYKAGEKYTSKNIATVTVQGVWSADRSAGLVPVTIEDPAVFSPFTGEDDIEVAGFEGNFQLNIVLDTQVTQFSIVKVEMAMPSYDANFDTSATPATAPTVTIGENLNITVSLLDAHDQPAEGVVAWTCEPTTATVTAEGNVYTVNTANVPAGQVKLTGKINELEQTYTFNVKNPILGDANDNGAVTVSDVVATANYIAALTATSEFGVSVIRFDYPNGNVAGGTEINTDDVNGIVNLIFGKPASGVRRHASAMNNDELVVDNFKVALNRQFEIGVNLNNTVQYSSLQAVVEIPEGMQVVGVTQGERAANHQMVYRIENGKVAVVIFSASNEAFAGGEGSLFNLVVTANEEAGNININGIHASDADANGYDLGFTGGLNDSVITGIYDLSAEDDVNVRYYTLDGVQVQNPAAGQIVIRVSGDKAEKVVVK